MAERLTHLFPQSFDKASYLPSAKGLDSSHYRPNPQGFGFFLRPFQRMGQLMVACLLTGLGVALIAPSSPWLTVLMSMIPVLGFFYLSGNVWFHHFSRRERESELELDYAGGLVRYKSRQQDLLFMAEQVELSVWQRSLLLPYRVDQVVLYLKGGQTLRCSNLLITPEELLDFLQAPLVREQKWFL